MTDVRVGRRDLLRYGASAVGLVAMARLLTACGDPADDRVKFFNWQDYVDPNLLDGFERASGLTVSYSTYASNDELGDRLALAGVPRRGNRRATGFDLIVPSDSLFRRLRDQDRLQELDTDIVTEELLANLDDVYRSLDVDPGNRFSIPWATGTTGIGYDTKVFPEPPTWDVFLDATHAGKLALLDEKREAFAAAQFSLGIDPNTTDAAEIDAAAARLAEMLEVARLDSTTYLDGLERGELVAAQAFSTDVLQAQEVNPDLAFVIPEAGGSRWIDLLCIPTDAANAEGANRFIAFYLDGQVAAQNAVAIKADVGNAAAQPFLSPEITDNPTITPPPALVDRLVDLRDLGDDEERYNSAWETVRS